MTEKTFHRIWLSEDGEEEVKPRFEEYWNKFQQLHPGYEFATYRNEKTMREWLINIDLWDKVDPLAGKTDILRYEIVARYGGVYVDTDMEPLKSWEPLFELDKPFIGWESEKRLCPTVIGGPREHPALIQLIEELPKWVAAHEAERDPVIQTGPEFITAMWGMREDVVRLPLYAFYPYGPTEWPNVSEGKWTGRSYGVHWWTKGWKPQDRR